MGGRAGGLRCLLRFRLMDDLDTFRLFAEVGRGGAKKWPEFDEQLVLRFLP